MVYRKDMYEPGKNPLLFMDMVLMDQPIVLDSVQ